MRTEEGQFLPAFCGRQKQTVQAVNSHAKLSQISPASQPKKSAKPADNQLVENRLRGLAARGAVS